MKTCPNCAFLVADDATECGVCHRSVVLPPQPTGDWRIEPAPPGGAGGSAPWAPVTSGEQQPAPATGPPAWVPPAPVAPTSAGRPAVIIALSVALGLAVLILLALVAVTFIGRKVEPASAAPPQDWKAYSDPAGRFRVEFPGTPSIRNQQEQAGLAAPVQTVTAEVARRSWDSFVIMVDLPADPGGIEIAPQGQLERLFDGLRSKATVTDFAAGTPKEVSSPTGPALDARFTMKDRSPSLVGFVRVLRVGPDSYMLVTIGPAAKESQVQAAQDRMVGSFTSPAPA
jgi:hypothetical protein